VEAVVVDAEVVGDLVYHRGDHFVHDVFVGLADLTYRRAVDEDPVWHLANAVVAPLRKGNAVIEAEHVGVLAPLFDQKYDVVDERKQILGNQVNGLANESLEAAVRDQDHNSNELVTPAR